LQKEKDNNGNIKAHKLLSEVFGEVPAGQTTAIMGVSLSVV
jgi:hypothetical protein